MLTSESESVSLSTSLTCLLVNDVTKPWHDRTYLHTRNHISDQTWFSFVCKVRVSSVASLEHVIKKKKSIPWNSCARILPSFFPGCAVLIRFPRGAGGSVQAVSKCVLLPGCRIVSGSSQSPWRAGAPDRFCASKLFKLLLVPHILPFFRLAAIIFFFCKIFCKQPQKKKQKAIIKKGKERWHYDQETIAISHPSRHLATCCWHEVGANDLFVQRYIFYEEFVKLLNML